jgi:hypothetical protein
MNFESDSPLSVLIGSRAYWYQLAEADPRIQEPVDADWDLIVTKPLAKRLFSEATEVRGNLAVIPSGKVLDLEVLRHQKRSSTILYDYCRDRAQRGDDRFKVLELADIGRVIIPSLEMLYVVYKSHIHRIIPASPHETENIEAWFKAVEKYTTLRTILGYKEMDRILYQRGFYEPPLSNDSLAATPLTSETEKKSVRRQEELHCVMREIFQLRFREVTARVGDTFDLAKEGLTEQAFFQDGVPRYGDSPYTAYKTHDDIHAAVARLLRDGENGIFTGLQFVTDSVGEKLRAADVHNEIEISKTLFEKLEKNIRYEMMREEIMVLFLERHLIPILVQHRQQSTAPFVGFDKDLCLRDLKHIIAHFVTNLCGYGHYWVRRFCLDHFSTICDPSLYDLTVLEQCAYDLVDVQVDPNAQPESFLRLFQLDIDNSRFDICPRARKCNYVQVGTGEILYTGDVYKIPQEGKVFEKVHLELRVEPKNLQRLMLIVDRFDETAFFGVKDDRLFLCGLKNGWCISKTKETWYVGRLRFSEKNNDYGHYNRFKPIEVEYEMLNAKSLKKRELQTLFKRDVTRTSKRIQQRVIRKKRVYYSSAGECGWCNSSSSSADEYSRSTEVSSYESKSVDYDVSYLSSFGDLPCPLDSFAYLLISEYLDMNGVTFGSEHYSSE